MHTVRSPAAPGRSRIYEKIIRDTAHVERCSSIAELLEAVKCRCARLRVPYTRHELDDAIAAMGNAVLALLVRPPEIPAPSPAPSPAPLTQHEAAAILARITARVPVAAGPKVMPNARPVTPREADRGAAFRIAVQAVRDQAQRCRDAERPPDQGPEAA